MTAQANELEDRAQAHRVLRELDWNGLTDAGIVWRPAPCANGSCHNPQPNHTEPPHVAPPPGPEAPGGGARRGDRRVAHWNTKGRPPGERPFSESQTTRAPPRG